MSDLIAELQAIVGANNVLLGDDVLARNVSWGNPKPCLAKAIVRPANTSEVADILRLCHQTGQSVVPHGGLTGLVDGAVATEDQIALSLERMNKIEELDESNRTLTVQAGVPLQTAQERAEAADLFLALDLGARGSCTLGGNISTNAGGSKVIRYGMARDNVLGLEAVLADGTVVSSLNKLIKNNSGFDLKHLFIGTEGTLGIVTRIVLRLRPRPKSWNTALVAMGDYAHVVATLKRVDADFGGTLSAFEVMWNDYYQLASSPPSDLKPPIPHGHPYYILIESMGSDQETDSARFETVLTGLFEDGLAVDGTIAKSDTERRAIWAIRDNVESLHELGAGVHFDISLSINDIENYVGTVREQLEAAWPGTKSCAFGHLGDNNLHFVVGAADPSETTRHKVKDIVYGALRTYPGAVSAEHGIGLDKKDYLPLSREPAELALMRTLKQTMDPKNLLNPNKVFSL